MDIFISHTSALEYWRKHQQGALTGARQIRAKLPTTPPDTRALQIDAPRGLDYPLHIMVANSNARKVSEGIISHIQSASFLRGSFFVAPEGFKISSPELMFLQMANILSFAELIKLAYELCGIYVLNPESYKGFDECEPLTSVAKLTSFVQKMKGAYGRQQALRVLKYTLDKAASPRETIVAICITLPNMLGGFGFPAPTLNARIEPNRFARGTANKQCYYCDLYWHDARLALEYDSDAHHTGPERIAADAMRRNTLELMGIKVISVTNEQIKSSEETRKLAITLSKHLGAQLRLKEPDFTRKFIELRKGLFAQ